MKISTFLGVIGIGLIVSLAGYFLYKRKKNSPIRHTDSERAEPIEEESATSKNAIIDVSKLPSEFSKWVKHFSGIYEALYQIADGTSEDTLAVIADWNSRIEQIKDCPNLTNYWESLFESPQRLSKDQLQQNAKNVLGNIVFACGITRDENSDCVVEENTYQRYHPIHGAELIIGENLKVVMPCWQFNTIILEKGILTK